MRGKEDDGMVAVRSINGAAPPIEPLRNGYRITKSDIYSDSTSRSTETGRLLQYLIRTGVVTIELQYEGTVAEISALEELVSGTSLTVVFLDRGTYVTKHMYPSDRVKEIISLNGNGIQRLSFSLIEI